ncbi:hypothetical protein ACFSJW_00665 [Flavobacterium artemisiae]|uniref:Uncharacterized protein n=1 Tax=Flavobacterium artemisiae TaxID=2126556 RepID=A0ABW4HHN5_9FLAO
MNKIVPNPEIANIKPGEIDGAGNKVIHILSKGNEFCIYEIEHHDINYRLRVQIDGYTDDSERELVNRFNIVKRGYTVAKGLLYRSQNYGMMKNRISHILSACFHNDEIPEGDEFDSLIEEIKTEIKRTSINRLFYLSPSIIFTFIFSLLCFFFSETRIDDYQNWHVLIVLLGSLLGNSISVLSSIGKINFEESTYYFYYSLIGIERIFLSCVAGAIVYCLIRSKFIFPQIEITDYWKIIIIVIIASFSEKLIPNLLGKIENKIK